MLAGFILSHFYLASDAVVYEGIGLQSYAHSFCHGFQVVRVILIELFIPLKLEVILVVD